mmetsp:Transcript_34982/g.74393  ORF Transcript_34982/g.74393 Transcript_34982/m.74393 type:complete len:139 (-) Transcript_34982:159-575(-)
MARVIRKKETQGKRVPIPRQLRSRNRRSPTNRHARTTKEIPRQRLAAMLAMVVAVLELFLAGVAALPPRPRWHTLLYTRDLDASLRHGPRSCWHLAPFLEAIQCSNGHCFMPKLLLSATWLSHYRLSPSDLARGRRRR